MRLEDGAEEQVNVKVPFPCPEQYTPADIAELIFAGMGPVVTTLLDVTPGAETVCVFPLHPELESVTCPEVAPLYTILF